jgi:hypothetical protein
MEKVNTTSAPIYLTAKNAYDSLSILADNKDKDVLIEKELKEYLIYDYFQGGDHIDNKILSKSI